MNRTVREYVEQVKREDFIREEPEQTSEATATEEEEGLTVSQISQFAAGQNSNHRLCGLPQVKEQFLLAATVQNVKGLIKFLNQTKEPKAEMA